MLFYKLHIVCRHLHQKAFRLITPLFALLLLILLNFENSAAEPPELKFQRIYDGLMSGRITAIHQDHTRYMWVGTNSGLHRYNGIEFEVYLSGSDSTTLISEYIGYIFEDQQNRLWIGTAGGINLYDRNTDRFIRFPFEQHDSYNPETTSGVRKILEDQNGVIWVAGGSENLYRLDNVNQQLTAYAPGYNYGIHSMYANEDNSLWIATRRNGLIRLNTENGSVVEEHRHDPNNPASLPSNNIETIIKDRNGTLWIGTLGRGLARMETDGSDTVFHRYHHVPGDRHSLLNNFVLTLHLDRDQNLWIGNENGGLHFYDPSADRFYQYQNDPNSQYSLTDNSIWVMYHDMNGRYWIGTGQTGLNIADRFNHKFSHYREPMIRGGLKSYVMRDVLEGSRGEIWFATDGGGISHFDRETETFTSYLHDPDDPASIGSDAALHLNFDKAGRLWIGTFRGGLNILTDRENGIFTSFQEFFHIDDEQFPSDNIFATHFDHEHDTIWIGSYGEGLYRLDPNTGQFDRFHSESGSAAIANYIVNIFEDSRNNIWIATLEGLFRIASEDKDQVRFEKFTHDRANPESLPRNVVHHVMEDSQQNIWVATSDGLARFDAETNTFITYTTDDGLVSNNIKSINLDLYGNLWIATNRGISRFDTETQTFKNFTRTDGLQGDEFSQYSTTSLQNGELVFGGMNGFTIFHPDDVVDNPFAPPVYITDFKLLNRSVAIGGDSPLQKHISVTDTLNLSYDQNIFTFEFIGLNYTQTVNNRYAYMLEGFEDDWNYVGTQRNATYTNMNPGNYTFRVKAANHDGVWNEMGASLVLNIAPPFWQTNWFYLLMGFLGVSFFGFIYRYKVMQVQQQNRLLEREVAERTEDLKETLRKLKESQKAVVDKAHKAGMAEIAAGVLHNVGNVLTSVNTSALLIKEKADRSKLTGLVNANQILRENIDRLDEFIANDPRSKPLMEYYLKLEEPLLQEHRDLVYQAERLSEKIKIINEVIAAQQNYAGASMFEDHISLTDVIENALSLQAGSIERHGLNVVQDFKTRSSVKAQRAKLIHVLVNLFKNAKEAMEENHPENRTIQIKTWQDDQHIYLTVTDNGSGIKPAHLQKVFSHSFTTKKDGHGFGLHSSANYMQEMGGSIEAVSEGLGKGSVFKLTFPISDSPTKSNEELNEIDPASHNGKPST
ncbi:two-component regulator propeller domain-containing protein [Rhodohalobacter sp. SW132]|nr:two-component regulator propeller domain-containing protein [Rhodohalobacter sp. SW132]